MARQTHWVDSVMSRSVVSGGQDQVSILQGDESLYRGATVIRTMVMLDCFSQTVAGAWGVTRLDYGIGIASREAQLAGALPDPIQHSL